MQKQLQFDTYTFFPEQGQLTKKNAEGQEEIIKLPPQPCDLLKLLIDAYPKIVTQSEIKAAFWPDVHQGYERSLHYCIRQIRVALKDEASSPRFIETVPKRGYRWMVPLEDAIDPAEERTYLLAGSRRRITLLSFGFLFLMLLSALFFYSNRVLIQKPSSIFRVAIMSFLPDQSDHPFSGNDIALRLLDRLHNQDSLELEVIGPTTTNGYSPDQLRPLIKDLQVDFLLNGRFVPKEKRLLAEVIRAKDGAHVWTKFYEVSVPVDSMVAEMVSGFLEVCCE